MDKRKTPINSQNIDTYAANYSKNTITDFGGWESEESKLKHNLTWTSEQILTWLEEINRFNREIRENAYVLREYY